MEHKPEYYLQKYLIELNKNGRLLAFADLVANGKRPDGTYNYCRDALEKKAKDLLKELKNDWL